MASIPRACPTASEPQNPTTPKPHNSTAPRRLLQLVLGVGMHQGQAELEGGAQDEAMHCGHSRWLSAGLQPLWVSQQLSQDDCAGKKCDIKSREALPLEGCGH